MADPIRIRAQVVDGTTDVHVLMPHPMETGLRKDDGGNFVPAHYIREVQITLGARVVLKARFGRGVAEDPLLHFRVKGGASGERIEVAWVDSRGERRTDQTFLA